MQIGEKPVSKEDWSTERRCSNCNTLLENIKADDLSYYYFLGEFKVKCLVCGEKLGIWEPPYFVRQYSIKKSKTFQKLMIPIFVLILISYMTKNNAFVAIGSGVYGLFLFLVEISRDWQWL